MFVGRRRRYWARRMFFARLGMPIEAAFPGLNSRMGLQSLFR